MNRIISTDSELRLFLPNVVRTLPGESPLFEKIEAYIDSAQSRVAELMVSPELMEAAASSDPGTQRLRQSLRPLVAAMAFADAIPSLDLVLTPNGFGVVQSQSVVPASERRVSALRESLLLAADDLIRRTLDELRRMQLWRESVQGMRWRSSLFQDPADLRVADPSHNGPLFERFLAVRPSLANIEDSLAGEWISQELLEEFRKEIQARSISEYRLSVASDFMCCVAGVFAGNPPDASRLSQIVNKIRHDRESFPAWHHSRTALLFVHRNFSNRPDSSGFFF